MRCVRETYNFSQSKSQQKASILLSFVGGLPSTVREETIPCDEWYALCLGTRLNIIEFTLKNAHCIPEEECLTRALELRHILSSPEYRLYREEADKLCSKYSHLFLCDEEYRRSDLTPTDRVRTAHTFLRRRNRKALQAYEVPSENDSCTTSATTLNSVAECKSASGLEPMKSADELSKSHELSESHASYDRISYDKINMSYRNLEHLWSQRLCEQLGSSFSSSLRAVATSEELETDPTQVPTVRQTGWAGYVRTQTRKVFSSLNSLELYGGGCATRCGGEVVAPQRSSALPTHALFIKQLFDITSVVKEGFTGRIARRLLMEEQKALVEAAKPLGSQSRSRDGNDVSSTSQVEEGGLVASFLLTRIQNKSLGSIFCDCSRNVTLVIRRLRNLAATLADKAHTAFTESIIGKTWYRRECRKIATTVVEAMSTTEDYVRNGQMTAEGKRLCKFVLEKSTIYKSLFHRMSRVSGRYALLRSAESIDILADELVQLVDRSPEKVRENINLYFFGGSQTQAIKSPPQTTA